MNHIHHHHEKKKLFKDASFWLLLFCLILIPILEWSLYVRNNGWTVKVFVTTIATLCGIVSVFAWTTNRKLTASISGIISSGLYIAMIFTVWEYEGNIGFLIIKLMVIIECLLMLYDILNKKYEFKKSSIHRWIQNYQEHKLINIIIVGSMFAVVLGLNYYTLATKVEMNAELWTYITFDAIASTTTQFAVLLQIYNPLAGTIAFIISDIFWIINWCIFTSEPTMIVLIIANITYLLFESVELYRMITDKIKKQSILVMK